MSQPTPAPRLDIDTFLSLPHPDATYALIKAWRDSRTKYSEDLKRWGAQFTQNHPLHNAYFSLLENVLIRSNDWPVRIAITQWLASCSDPLAFDGLQIVLHNPDPDVRATAANALIDLQKIDILIDALSDRNHRVRRAAAAALGKTNDPRATQPLIHLLFDKDSFVVKCAAESLTLRQNTEAVPVLIDSLSRTSLTKPWLRAMLFAQALESLADNQATHILITSLSGPIDLDVRASLVRALLQIYRNDIDSLCGIIDKDNSSIKVSFLITKKGSTHIKFSPEHKMILDTIARNFALSWLRALIDQDALSKYISAHFNDESFLLLRCIKKLKYIRSQESVDFLKRILFSSVNTCLAYLKAAAKTLGDIDQNAAHENLLKLSKSIYESLLGLLKQQSVNEQYAWICQNAFAMSLEILASFKNTDIVNMLWEWAQGPLHSPSPFNIAHNAIIDALALLDAEKARPLLIECVRERRASSIQVKAFASIYKGKALANLGQLLISNVYSFGLIKTIRDALVEYATEEHHFDVLRLLLALGCCETNWTRTKDSLQQVARQWLHTQISNIDGHERRCLDEILLNDMFCSFSRQSFDVLWRRAERSGDTVWLWFLFCWWSSFHGVPPQLLIDEKSVQWRTKNVSDFLCAPYSSERILRGRSFVENEKSPTLRIGWNRERATVWLHDLYTNCGHPKQLNLRRATLENPQKIKNLSDRMITNNNNSQYDQRQRLPFFALLDLNKIPINRSNK